MNNLTRDKCVICEGSLSSIEKLENFPLYMGTSEQIDFVYHDMNWASCVVCGCVQLSELIDLSVLYKIPHNPAVGKTWESHNLKFSDLVRSYSPHKVLDVGGANLKLANLISVDDHVDRYDIVDFSSTKYEFKKISDKIGLVIGSAENYAEENKFDCVILSHTLEHLYEPTQFLRKMKSCLTERGKIFVSVPNIRNQLNDGFLNALHFEHTYYIDHEYVEMMGNNAGLNLVQRLDFSEYNSFYVFSPGTVVPKHHSKPADSSNIFCKFIQGVKDDVKQINEITRGKEFYAFGAHVFTQYLLNFGMNSDRLLCIIDNDANKTGKFLYGTSMKVSAPTVLKQIDKPMILLRVAQYKNEIVEQILEINDDVRFI